MMLLKKTVGIIICGLCLMSPAHAGSMKTLDSVTINYDKRMSIDADFGEYYENKVALVEKNAAKNHLENFKILSQSMSASGVRDSEGEPSITVQAVISVTFAANNDAINALLKESGGGHIFFMRNEMGGFENSIPQRHMKKQNKNL